MAARDRPPRRLAGRVSSIIRMQALLFDPGNPDSYEELLDFERDPRPTKIARVVSILRAQEIILGSGLYLDGGRARDAAGEIPALVAYVRSLLEADRILSRRLAILPRNLGKPFAARRWGLPLFGDYRPAAPPAIGRLLLYTSPDKDGRSASIAASRLGPTSELAYRGPALVVDSAEPWLRLDAAPADEFDPEAGGPSRRDRYLFSRYGIVLDRRPRSRRLRGKVANPFEYEYAYLFYDGPGAMANVARFVADLLSAILHVPIREAERIGLDFSGRLP